MYTEEEEEDVELLNDIQEEVVAHIKEGKTTYTNILTELKKVKQKLSNIE